MVKCAYWGLSNVFSFQENCDEFIKDSAELDEFLQRLEQMTGEKSLWDITIEALFCLCSVVTCCSEESKSATFADKALSKKIIAMLSHALSMNSSAIVPVAVKALMTIFEVDVTYVNVFFANKGETLMTKWLDNTN